MSFANLPSWSKKVHRKVMPLCPPKKKKKKNTNAFNPKKKKYKIRMTKPRIICDVNEQRCRGGRYEAHSTRI